MKVKSVKKMVEELSISDTLETFCREYFEFKRNFKIQSRTFRGQNFWSNLELWSVHLHTDSNKLFNNQLDT